MNDWDVFISYSHADDKLAQSIAGALRRKDLNVWIDHQIEVGGSFQGAISEALEQAGCVLVLWTAESIKSDFVRDEARQAKRHGTLFPCFLSAEIENEIPMGQQETQGLKLDAEGGALTVSQLQELVAEVEKRLATRPRRPGIFEAARDIRNKLELHLKDRYLLINEVGRGNSSVVFRARSVEAAKATYAIKVTTVHSLLLNDGLYDAFVAASEAAKSLQHPKIISAHNVERKDDLILSVTRFVDGRSLAATIKEEQRLSTPVAQSILMQVASALAHAHEQGVIHHALRPSKIVVDRQGNAFVTDFGLGRVRASREKQRPGDRLLGEPTYMSPEQCLGEKTITGKSDQYSLGVIAYEILTGAPPFEGASPLLVMKKHCDESPAPLGDVCQDCPAFEKIVMRMLRKDPNERYASLGVVEHELRHAISTGDPIRQLARASYLRCCELPYFLDMFYDAFVQSDSRVAQAFRTVEVSAQARMLRKALDKVFEVEFDTQDNHATVSGIAQRHLSFPPELYDMFIASLLDTVKQLDSRFDPQVDAAWRQVLGEFVGRLKTAITAAGKSRAAANRSS